MNMQAFYNCFALRTLLVCELFLGYQLFGENDVSLLQLAGEIVYTNHIIPVCLPIQNENIDSGTQCWISGWGITRC